MATLVGRALLSRAHYVLNCCVTILARTAIEFGSFFGTLSSLNNLTFLWCICVCVPVYVVLNRYFGFIRSECERESEKEKKEGSVLLSVVPITVAAFPEYPPFVVWLEVVVVKVSIFAAVWLIL